MGYRQPNSSACFAPIQPGERLQIRNSSTTVPFFSRVIQQHSIRKPLRQAVWRFTLFPANQTEKDLRFPRVDKFINLSALTPAVAQSMKRLTTKRTPLFRLHCYAGQISQLLELRDIDS